MFLIRIFIVVTLSLPLVTLGADEVDFARDIRPILSENCSFCHGPDEATREADLRLDTESGAADVLQPGDVQASELFRRITSGDADELMPPPDSNRQLSKREIELIRRWIDEGAVWEQHWAFRPIVAPPIPDVPHLEQAPIRNPIDAFVQRLLADRGMSPSPEASRSTLIRRLSLDLTGLPPTPGQVDAFVADSRPDAYERLVDQLLDSPSYGVRMAWPWLDAARYADTNGYQGDRERTMWPWRDWVVEAFNRNMPFDQFTVWQLAGDLLPDATQEQKLATGFCRNHMINGEGGRIPEENRVEYVMDMSETMGTVWLGLTLNCCRCHDHKYDPISNEEYYQLFAFFNQTPVTGGGGDPQTPPNLSIPNEEQAAELAALQQRIAEADQQLNQLAGALAAKQPEWEQSELQRLEAEIAKEKESETKEVEDEKANSKSQELLTALQVDPQKRSPEQRDLVTQAHRQSDAEYVQQKTHRDRLVKQREDLQNRIPKAMVMADMASPRDTFVLQRGLYNKPTDKVQAKLPEFLPAAPDNADSMNRLTLAQWLVDPSNPLTARVTVNRFWQQVFGIGLVKTTEDFGTQGETPVHLDLLNWLTFHFQEEGWDVKDLMRLIVTSHAYRQTSKFLDRAAYAADPDNRLLSRSTRYRLPSWMLRDQALAASGLLSPVVGGPSVNTYQPPGIWEEASFGKKTYKRDDGEKLYRRSLFVFWRRIIAPTMFFDSASRQTCTVNINRTNTPLHALQTLNDVTYVEAARALAQEVLLEHPGDDPQRLDPQRIDAVMKRVLARPAKPAEQKVLIAGLHRTRNQFADRPEEAIRLIETGESPRDPSIQPAEHAAWTSLALAVLNLDEALNRE